jgi:hypothetical protein
MISIERSWAQMFLYKNIKTLKINEIMLSANFQDKVNKRRESLAIAENRHDLEEALAKVKSRKDPFECSAIIHKMFKN